MELVFFLAFGKVMGPVDDPPELGRSTVAFSSTVCSVLWLRGPQFSGL